jgi:hypothetical protein
MRTLRLVHAIALACALALGCTTPQSATSARYDGAAPLELPKVGLFDRVVARTLDPAHGGSTTDVSTGEAIETGGRFVAVSLEGGEAVPATTPPGELRSDLERFVASRPILAKPQHYLGTWHDKAEGLIYLDVTVLLPYSSDRDRRAALAEANTLGAANGQKSIFDLGNGKTYKVDAARGGGDLEEY